MYNVGKQIEVELLRVTEDGRGVGFLDDGRVVVVENCATNDESAFIEIVRVLEETILAKKIGKSGLEKTVPKRPDLVNSAYTIEDDEDDEDDEDYDEDDIEY